MKKLLALAVILLAFIFGCKDNATEPIQTDKPFVEIISPEDNSVFSDSLLIKIEAGDDKGIVQVDLYIDNRTDYSRMFFVEPYEYLWVPSVEPDSAKHKIYAKAYDGDENMTSSKVISVYHIKLTPPNNFTVNSVSETSLKLSWINHLSNAEGFIIERMVNEGNNSFEKIGESFSAEFEDRDLSRFSSYSYRVKAYRGSDTTAYSEIVSVQHKIGYVIFKSLNQATGEIDKKTPVALAPDGTTFLYAYQNSNDFYSYNVLSNEYPDRSYVGSSLDYITDISSHGQGRIIFSSTKGNVFGKAFPIMGQGKTFFLDAGKIDNAIFLGTPDLFAAATESGKIVIYDYDQSQVFAFYDNVISSGEVSLAYDSSDDILISASESGYMTQYKVSQKEIRLTQYVKYPITALCFDQYSKMLYIGQKNGVIKRWNTQENVLVDSLQASIGEITDIKTARNGEIMIAAGMQNAVKFWKTNSYFREYTKIINAELLSDRISIAATDNIEYIITGSKNAVVVWKLMEGWMRF